MLVVEVIYALPEQAERYVVALPEGATAALAVERSGVLAAHPEIDLARDGLAVFGRRVPPERRLAAGDRVEVLRPLVADPKSARRDRAARKLR